MGAHPPVRAIYVKYRTVKLNNRRLHIRIPAQLLASAYQRARQSNETLSGIVRAYLEAYTASQLLEKAE